MDRTRVLVRTALVTACLALLGVSLGAQSGPYSAQIQQALRSFTVQPHTWSGAQTVTEILWDGGGPMPDSYALPNGNWEIDVGNAYLVGRNDDGFVVANSFSVRGNAIVNYTTTAGAALYGQALVTASTAVGVDGVHGEIIINGTAASTVEGLTAVYGDVQLQDTASAANVFGNYVTFTKAAGASISNLQGYYVTNLTGLATNAYYFWADSQGVYRIREDATFNSVGQAIATLYNPQFTKYTPGATNFERCIPGCQWESNVAVVTTEAGGTGTLRAMKLGDAGVPVLTTVTTFTSLPACNSANKSAIGYITDSTTATWGANAAGSGANNVGVQCNGTNWTVFSK